MTMQRFAVALEPEHRELRLERVGDIGAFRRRLAGRDQEQPLQLEGVVDTNRASVAHVCRDERAKGREPLVLEGQRVERRQSPILSLRPEKIGRRADRKTFAEPLRTRPDLGAAAVGARRRGRGRGRRSCRRRARAGRPPRVGCPRAIAARHGTRPAPGCRRGSARIVGEAAARYASGHSPSQAAPSARKCSESASKVAWSSSAAPSSRRKASKAGSPPSLERRPQRIEDRPQDLPDAGVIDELSLAQRGDARALLVEEALRRACRETRDRGRVDVQRLEEQARGRRIGRDLRRGRRRKGHGPG